MKNFFLLTLIFFTLVGQAQSVIPQKESGNKFSISCTNIYFQIDSTDGARISSFKLGGEELLYTAGFGSTDMAGSTFWPSPQSVWNWPPITNLDNKPYKTRITGNKIKFTGSTDSKTNLRFYKTMYANEADTSIVIEYCMKNEKSSAQSWAPWEVTRVEGKGLTVFAKGEGSITGILAPSTDELNGYIWYDQDNNIVNNAGTYKFNCDGKGWLAHVIGGNKLFIKKFEDIPKAKAATGEAEVEVYTTQNNTYTELEDQGAYASIASKDSVIWTVKWFARNLPSSVDVSIGSTSLTGYIEAVIARSTDGVGKPEIKVTNAVKLYPNPASKFLVVESNLSSYADVSLFIYNLQGKIVMKQPINQSMQQLSTTNLLSGMYIYELKQNSISVGRGNISVK
jgi:hypothetical protein